MSKRFSISAFGICFVTLSLMAAPVAAQGLGCKPGSNVLEEIKVKQPNVYAEIRKSADAEENAKHVLWKIEHKEFPQRGPSYLFGTIHVTDDRVQFLPAAAKEAFDSARIVGVEVEDLTQSRLTEAMTTLGSAGLLLLPGTDRLDKLLTANEYKRADVVLAKTGLPPEQLGRVQPWVALAMYATMDCDRSRITGNGKLPLDGEIARLAEMRGVGTVGIETLELQLQAMAAVPQSDQVALLKAQLANADRMHDLTETLLQLYLARDFGAIWPLQVALAKQAGIDEKVFEAYKEHMLTARNRRMVDRIYMHVERGGIFMSVGALHLSGKSGLVNMFREMGYEVTPVE